MDLDEIILKDLKQIGSGGQSKIFVGQMMRRTDLILRYVVAKEIKNTCQDVLQKELKIKDLSHDNVIKVFGYVTNPDSYYIVSEYLESGDLEDFIANKYDLLKENILHKIKGMIEGLDFLHIQRILHLDLHPKNILIAPSQKFGHLFKISDFGYSEVDEMDICFRSVVGRPGYTCPEVLMLIAIAQLFICEGDECIDINAP